jgi:hypothetical protein
LGEVKTALIARWLMAGAAASAGAAALVNAYNYQQFSTSITKLREDGLLN